MRLRSVPIWRADLILELFEHEDERGRCLGNPIKEAISFFGGESRGSLFWEGEQDQVYLNFDFYLNRWNNTYYYIPVLCYSTSYYCFQYENSILYFPSKSQAFKVESRIRITGTEESSSRFPPILEDISSGIGSRRSVLIAKWCAVRGKTHRANGLGRRFIGRKLELFFLFVRNDWVLFRDDSKFRN